MPLYHKMTIWGGFLVPPKILFFDGHFSKWIFAEGRPSRSLWCLEKIQGPIWRSKDLLVMKGLSKNVRNHVLQKKHKKGSRFFFIGFLEVFQFPENIIFRVGVLFQNGFSPKAVQPEAPWL